jgi:DNA topoisomerase I
VDAYCVKCKQKREVQDAQATFNVNGNPVTRGICSVCGTKIVRIGKTTAHEGLIAPPTEERIKRSGKLVIVESPAKAKTVGRILGKGFTVKASIGHIRDLLRSSLSVDVEDNFKPTYRVPNEKRAVVKELKQMAKNAEEVFLATDPDREGEAIAWHLLEAAEIVPERSTRVVFHEITEGAIREAFAHSRKINMDLVDAQQARRILDRLVGYSISPILWEKVRSRLSAGRVQSVALRLIVEREKDIQSFLPVEYWSIQAELKPEKVRQTFIANLVRVDDQEPVLPNEEIVQGIVQDLEKAAYIISRMKKGERKRKPSPPFITSTLQQEASRKMGYTTKRTMRIAQQLYEGLDVGEGGSTGLISYMRTDSTNVAEVAQNEARQLILQNYGENFLPPTAPMYRTKAKGAQEAHEAIRPTSVMRFPDQLKPLLTPEQFQLYQLIWRRFLASQMEAAIFDTVSVEVTAQTVDHQYLFRASGSTLRFPGFLVVYEETVEEDLKTDEPENVRIPAGLEENQKQHLVRVIPEQHFTQPPPRFSEASLVQVLEEYGIGRPSTYAPILSTIQDRGYVYREAKKLYPTEVGFLVTDLMVNHFSEIVDVNFTANMEQDLDKVSEGKSKWQSIVGEFYQRFEPVLKKAQQEIPVTKTEEKVGRACPDCGHDLIIRWGRYGKFISCSSFPECHYTEAWLEKIDVPCPECGGDIVQRKTRKGRIFYGCANYPTCNFTSWKRPAKVNCPNCGGLLVFTNKREVQCMKCSETYLQEIIGVGTNESA